MHKPKPQNCPTTQIRVTFGALGAEICPSNPLGKPVVPLKGDVKLSRGCQGRRKAASDFQGLGNRIPSAQRMHLEQPGIELG